jgi:hypothetical protein
MRSLDEAWDWYLRTRRLVRLMRRVAARYWEQLPWEEMGKDDHFKTLAGPVIVGDADAVLQEFDDLAVFVIFSVFEAIVRDHALNAMEPEAALIKNVALQHAAREMRDKLMEGGFYNNVLAIWKQQDPNLVEQINQVRQYRNWVAHGRRPDKKPASVDPKTAYDRLQQFLTLIGHGTVPDR